jgi:putative tricarboxylic transport membrane protein
MTISWKDVAAGAFFVAVGLVYGGMAWRFMPFGHALNMGPGYFPMLLSALLAILGAATLLRGLWIGEGSPFGIVPWRALLMLSLATIFFASFVRQLGLLPCVFASSMLASLSSPQIKPTTAAFVSLVIAVFSVGVFIYGINLPIPIFGSWLRG